MFDAQTHTLSQKSLCKAKHDCTQQIKTNLEHTSPLSNFTTDLPPTGPSRKKKKQNRKPKNPVKLLSKQKSLRHLEFQNSGELSK